ncbi:lactose 3-dehydrogenase subunit gamma LacC [Nibrella saemangeumensis]|uniref:Lactose 3-dehydrogenase subunit gamma LacC n=1 Tax=Nibrella saemangeumensis TaxID=1084526 RepID=A0ABP8MVL3_9BACT
MERRSALKSLAAAVGGLVTLPAWTNGWTEATAQPVQTLFTVRQTEVLAAIVETLIPESEVPGTEVPGAKSLGVHTFIQRMLEDCFEKNDQTSFIAGLNSVQAMTNSGYGKPFTACDATQRLEALKTIATAGEPGQKDFLSAVKNLTIQGYTTSEYVMTKHYHYEMAPGHYYGCVPVAIAQNQR